MNMFMKRVFLSLSILCSLFAGTYSGGSGYSFDPYQISNLNDLIELIQTPTDWSKYFLQTNDIDASSSQYWDDTDDNGNGNLFDDTNDATSAGNNDGFKPIGSNPTSFKGYYNGNGYTINGICINRANTQYVGLFGYFYSSLNFPYNRIENLYLSNVNISGKDHVGSICGSVHDGVLMNCSSTGSVSASSGYAGGLAGNSSNIIDCSSSCSIRNSGIYTGGLAGMLTGSIYTSYCDGDVEGDTYVGGLCGYKSLGYIYDSYSVASVSGTDNVGGLSGMLHGGGVSNCYASGEITSSGTYVGGFNGKNNGYCDVDNCFWDTVTTGMSTSPDGTGKSTNEMKTLSTYTDEGTTGLSDAWDFETNPFDDSGNDDDWDMDYSGNINNGYPYLSWQDGDNIALPAYYGHGSGTEGDPYQISDLSDLKSLSKASPDWNKYFIQTADIDASATEYWDDSDDDGNGHLYNDPNDLTSAGNNEGFPPIGTVSDEFTGNYDGNGYAINELNIDRSESYTGLFGRLMGAMITELGMTNAAVSGINYVGIIAGVNDENTSMSQCYSSGSVNGSGFAVGGLTGGVRYGTAELTLSYSTATVTASGNHAGGLIGFAYDADISDCYSRGSVNGANYVGSFCGYFTNGSVSNCYGTGSVSSTGSDVGGFVGSNTNDACIVTNCFWDTLTTGLSTSPGGIGKSTSEMKTLSTFTSAGWDFVDETNNGTDDIWDMDAGANNGYPILYSIQSTEVPLLITLNSFTATANNGFIELAWETATETNNANFVIYRNDDAIASIAGAGTTSEPHNYEYIDDQVIPDNTYTYILADVSYANEENKYIDKAVNIVIPKNDIPEEFALNSNYPNPFNPSTAISFQLSAVSDVELCIYDMNGRKIASLINDNKPAGYYEIYWDASNFSSGIYFYRLQAGDFVETKKMLLIK